MHQRYEGNNNPDHPFDRKSGTGRGTEVSKGGHGARNWGDYKDDLRGEVIEDENKKKKKPEKKEGDDDKKEVKEEPPVYSYDEYKAMQAEKSQGLAVKAPELKVENALKVSSDVKIHEKEKFNTNSELISKKKKEKKTTEESKTVNLGGYIERPIRRPEGEMRTKERKGKGKGGRKFNEPEKKEPERTPFVMKEEDFPSL